MEIETENVAERYLTVRISNQGNISDTPKRSSETYDFRRVFALRSYNYPSFRRAMVWGMAGLLVTDS
jgi:hypothetical protein